MGEHCESRTVTTNCQTFDTQLMVRPVFWKCEIVVKGERPVESGQRVGEMTRWLRALAAQTSYG